MELEADILVCHEAPSTHKYGFEVVDEIAEAMGVSLVVHGHHHTNYRSRSKSGIDVIGLDMEDYILFDKEMLRQKN